MKIVSRRETVDRLERAALDDETFSARWVSQGGVWHKLAWNMPMDDWWTLLRLPDTKVKVMCGLGVAMVSAAPTPGKRVCRRCATAFARWRMTGLKPGQAA